MSCNSAEALFERFLEAELAAGPRRALIAHVDGCAACRSVLEELQVVDGLLRTPRRIELATNFTFATMAQTRSLHSPVRLVPPLGAYLVSYLVAAWLVAGAAFVLAPQLTHGFAQVLVEIARNTIAAVGGFATVSARLLGRGGNVLAALLGSLLAFDALLVAAAGFALKYMRPRLVERLRS